MEIKSEDDARDKDEEWNIPFIAIGNGEPIPENLPEKIKKIIRGY